MDMKLKPAVMLILSCVLVISVGAQEPARQQPTKEQLGAKIETLKQVGCDPTDGDYVVLHETVLKTAQQLSNLLRREKEAKETGAWAQLAAEDRKRLEQVADAEIATIVNPCADQLSRDSLSFVSALAAMQGDVPSVTAENLTQTSAERIRQSVYAKSETTKGNLTSAGSMSVAGNSGKTKLVVDPVSLTFDRQKVGTSSAPKSITVTNVGVETVELLPLPIDSKNYAVSDNQCDGPVAAGAHCSIKIVFSPGAVQAGAASLPLVNSADFPEIKLQRAQNEALQRLAGELEQKSKDATDAYATALRDKKNTQAANEKKTQAEKLTQEALAKRKDADSSDKALRENLTKIEAASPRVELRGSADPFSYTFARLVAGVDASAATSKSTSQTYFVDLFVSAPVRFGHRPTDALDNRFFVFMDPRITSVAQQGTAASNLNVAKDLFNPDLSQKLTNVVQGLDVTAGGEYAFLRPRGGVYWPSFQSNARTSLGLSFVAAFGATTPFSNNSPTTNAQLNKSIKDAYPQTNSLPATTVNIAFVNQDRSRFYRKYYAGLRLKTFNFSRSLKSACDLNIKEPGLPKTAPCDAALDQFPGLVDLTLGQDEAVTGGKLRHLVFRMDAVYPFPFIPGMHVIGSLNLALAKNKLTTPVTIVNPSVTPTDANTFRIPVAPLDRDIFRIGIGMDIEQLLKAAAKKTTNAATDAKQANQ